jgi:hypothetical protein
MMLDSTDYICIDHIVPQEQAWDDLQKAIHEDPSNVSSAEAALLRRRRWRNGRTLHVAFLEGTLSLQEKVAFYAQKWCEYANIFLLIDNHPKAEIRIAFQPVGTWSAVGTSALTIPDNYPTMNFSWLIPTPSEEVFSHAVLHEFGHALGLIHEHQSPKGGIQWNRAAVIQAHADYSEEWIEQNIFKRYRFWQTQYTKFDPYSIMLYHIPSSWTLNGFETPINVTLSQADKDFIGRCYPGKG